MGRQTILASTGVVAQIRSGVHFTNPVGWIGGLPEPAPPRYGTTTWSEDSKALRRRGSLRVWCARDMAWLAEPAGRGGRPETFSDAAIQFCLSVKLVSGLPLRQGELVRRH